MRDRVTRIHTDAPFAFDENFETIARYADELKAATLAALEEEAVLVAALKVYHST